MRNTTVATIEAHSASRYCVLLRLCGGANEFIVKRMWIDKPLKLKTAGTINVLEPGRR